jgi:hypothetical protein
MRARLADASDRDAWDRHVVASPNGDYHQLYGWGEARSLSGWEPLRVLVEDGDIQGTLQMAARRLPGLGLRLFYAPRGPMMAAGVGAETCAALLGEATAQASARGGVFCCDSTRSRPPGAHRSRSGFPPAASVPSHRGGATGTGAPTRFLGKHPA